MWKVFVFASFEAVGSSIVLVLDGGTGDFDAEVSKTEFAGTCAEGPDSTAVAYVREARRGRKAGRTELKSRELDRRAAMVANVLESALQVPGLELKLCDQYHNKIGVVGRMIVAASIESRASLLPKPRPIVGRLLS